MEIRQLIIFRDAARTLNFTKTAANLNYAQSNITGQIKSLEQVLNTKLFERIGKGLVLTADGKRFLSQAEAILDMCEQAKSGLSGDYSRRGQIKIGVAETVAMHKLPRLLSVYRERFPLIDVRIITESTDNFYTLLRNNMIDMAIGLTTEVNEPDMNSRILYKERLTLVAHPKHRLVSRKIIKARDFDGETLMLPSGGCGYRTLILEVLKEHDVNFKDVMELSSVGAIKEFAASGLGIAFLPCTAVTQAIEIDKLGEISWPAEPLAANAQLIYHKSKWLSPTMQGFLGLFNENI